MFVAFNYIIHKRANKNQHDPVSKHNEKRKEQEKFK